MGLRRSWQWSDPTQHPSTRHLSPLLIQRQHTQPFSGWGPWLTTRVSIISETRQLSLLDGFRHAWLCLQENIYVRGVTTRNWLGELLCAFGEEKAASCYYRYPNYYNHRIIAVISGKAASFLPKRVKLDCLGRQCQHTLETNDKDGG